MIVIKGIGLLFIQHLVFRAISVAFTLWAMANGMTWTIVVAFVFLVFEMFQTRPIRNVTGSKYPELGRLYNLVLLLPLVGIFIVPWWRSVLEFGLVVQFINTVATMIVMLIFARAASKTSETVEESKTLGDQFEDIFKD